MKLDSIQKGDLMKICPKCKIRKDLSEFGTHNRSRKTGEPTGICKQCAANNTQLWRNNRTEDELRELRIRNIQWGKENPERLKMYRAKRRYGMSYEEFSNLPTECAICGSTEDLVIDHDHITGKFRGVLCRRHNLGLGHFDDDPIMLLRAIDYLMGLLKPYVVELMKEMVKNKK